MATWQVQQAKQRLSEVIRQALEDGPQVITRHGEEAVVVIAASEYRAAAGGRPDFHAFLTSAPDFDALDLERSERPPRSVSL